MSGPSAAKLSPARKVAFRALTEAAESEAYAREVVPRVAARSGTDSRDAALALRLAVGVTATSGWLDAAIDGFLKKPGSISGRVRRALRISAFELLYLGTSPEVAVSQGVELVRVCARASRACGLANAVLRRIASSRDRFFAEGDTRAKRSGLPPWLLEAISSSLTREEADAVVDAALLPAPFCLHVAPGAGDLPADSEPVPAPIPGSYRVGRAAPIIDGGALGAGKAVFSDLNAQMVAAMAVREGSCLEIGAGRGTKTFLMASMAQRAGIAREHLAVDVSEGKCRANFERVSKAGFEGISALAGDGRDLSELIGRYRSDHPSGCPDARFDSVLLDAPCSGTGTMRRHPEIAWRLGPEDIESELPELQLTLLTEAARYVAHGGVLLYATCSVCDSECRRVVEAFLDSEVGGDFKRVDPCSSGLLGLEGFEGARDYVRSHSTQEGCFRTLPTRGEFDGHFCAVMVRIAG